MGAIAFGTRLFGKVDSVRGVCYVSTRCWHFCYLPLIPLGTYVVFQEQHAGLSSTFSGVRVGFSWKSWSIAWVRCVLGLPLIIGIVCAIGFTVIAFEGGRDIHWGAVAGIWAFVAMLAGLWVASYYTPGVGRATGHRREALMAIRADIPPVDQLRTAGHTVG